MSRLTPEAAFRQIGFALLLAVALILANEALSQDDLRPRLLFVVESDSRLPFARTILNGVEQELGSEFTTRSEIYVHYLDMLRFNDPQELELNLSFLVERFDGMGIDAIGVLGSNALSFVMENQDAFAPDAPIVFGAFGEEGLKRALSGKTSPRLSGVISPHDFKSTLDLALSVQAEAPEIVFIAGSANFDRQWRTLVTAEVETTYRGVPVRFLPESTSEEYLAEVRALDPEAIVLLLSVNLDASGRRFLPIQFAETLSKASAAPVWSVYETQIGLGIVGGSVEDLNATGSEIGKMLRAAAVGAPLPDPVRMTAVPTVDWRVMQRHDLDVGRLPEGSRILFYQPTLWEEYRVVLLSVAAVVVAQMATIIGLLFHRQRYLRTQASLDSERSQLIHVSRNLRLGQLSASLAHEINQPLAAIQANAEAGYRIAGRKPADADEISAIFRDITDDVRRAGSTIAGLRRLIVKGEVARERLDLNEIVRATLPLVRNEMDADGTKVVLALAPGQAEVKGNAAQLQQVVLNLILNASEAMLGLSQSSRTVTLTTATMTDGSVALSVEDTGPGVAPDQRETAFRPFVSSKSSGLGVGLSICRSIAEAHGGTLAFADPKVAGARIVLTLPGLPT